MDKPSKFFISVFTIGILSTNAYSITPITTPWMETFDSYPAQTLNNPTFYPFAGGTAGQCSGGQLTQLTQDAEHDGSGMGIRWWVGNSKNDNSGTFAFKLANPTNEIWVRMYKRYASGFSWQGGGPNDEKVLWFVDSSQTQPIIYEHSRTACYDAVRGNVSDAIYFWMQGNSVNQVPCGQPNTGWVATQGGNTGDGQWHVYEVHIKKDTNGNNGILRVWTDGILKMNRTDINTGGGWPRDILHFQINQDSGANIGCKPVDIDNIAVHTSTPPMVDAQGYPMIGPIGWGGHFDRVNITPGSAE